MEKVRVEFQSQSQLLQQFDWRSSDPEHFFRKSDGQQKVVNPKLVCYPQELLDI